MKKLYHIIFVSVVSVFLVSGIVYAANTITSLQGADISKISQGDMIAPSWYQEVNDTALMAKNTIPTITVSLQTLSGSISTLSGRIANTNASQWTNYPNNTTPTGIYYPIGNIGIGVMPIDINIKLKVNGIIETSSGAGMNGGIKFPDGTIQTTAYSGTTGGDGSPVGTISAFFTSSCPTGWVVADGTNGTPDLRGEFIRGLDNGRGVDSGRVLGTTQSATAIRTLIDNYAGYAIGTFSINMRNVDGYLVGGGSNVSSTGDDNAYYVATASQQLGSGDNVSYFVRPRNIALLYCMKLSGASSTPSNNTTWTRVGNDVVQASTGIVQVNNGIKFPDGSIQASAGLGYGQTWQDMTASRIEGVTYINATGKPISIAISTLNDAVSNEAVWINVNGATIIFGGMSAQQRRYTASVVIPPGATYLVGLSHYSGHYIERWSELR